MTDTGLPGFKFYNYWIRFAVKFFEDVDTFVQIVDSESMQSKTFSELPLALGRSLIQEEITYTFITYIFMLFALTFPSLLCQKKALKALYRDDIFIAKSPADSWQLALYEKLLSTFFISRPPPRKSQGCRHLL